uniref:Uncharacterized protein n=2 Tax=Meloidogyne TaxID=189290 RepID=A0A914N005_MELIC
MLKNLRPFEKARMNKLTGKQTELDTKIIYYSCEYKSDEDYFENAVFSSDWRVRSHSMKIIMDEYQQQKLENKIALDFLVWVFWVEKQFKEIKEEIKYLNKMWLFRRGYFYSKYDELFELNDENKLEKEGNLMNKIQFGIWKNLKEKNLKKKNWEKEWKDIENGIIRVKKEEEKEFEEFLNEEKKKVLEKEINWEEEENLEEKEERKIFYKFIIEGNL